MCLFEKKCYIKCCCSYCNNFPRKRFLLPLVFIVCLTIINETRNMIYLPIIIGTASLILFWNFPWIVYYTASKPLYYEDLFIDVKKLPNYDVDKKIKDKFNCILVSVLIVSNSILMGVLADLWILRLNSDGNKLNIIAITGGVIKMFQIINNTISRFMLKILRKFVIKQNNIVRERKISDIKQVINLREIKTNDDVEENEKASKI